MALAATGITPMAHVDATDSFERLFVREYARLTMVAQRIVLDADDAEDVAQDVFAAFHAHHHADAPYASGWLYRAAVHTSLNFLRGKRRRSQREHLHAIGPEPALDAASDPQCLLESDEQKNTVRAALARLPVRSASVLALRYSGMSYVEIGEILGIKANGVGTLLSRAERALRKEIDRGPSF